MQKSRARFCAALTLLTLLIGLTLSGCSESDPPPKGPIKGGPLDAVTLGAQTYETPGAARVVTFGGVALCATEQNTNIQLDRVRFIGTPAGQSLTPWIRAVPIAPKRNGPAYEWRPLGVSGGYPGQPERFSTGPYRGAFTNKVKNFRIDQLCLGVGNIDSRRLELLTVMRASPAGAVVSKIVVDYHVGATDYVREIPVRQVVCGVRTTPRC